MKKSMLSAEGVGAMGKRMTEARLALSHRRRKEVTQVEVADALSVSAAAVGRWEKGRKFPALERIPLIADVLGCDPGWLTFGPTKPSTYVGDGAGTVPMPAMIEGQSEGVVRPPRGRRKRKSVDARRKMRPAFWYGYDALGDDVAVEQRA